MVNRTMEVKGCCQQWKTLPAQHSRGCLTSTIKDGERIKTKRERSGPQKSVTLAPTCRYVTERQYVMRKPLFSAEEHASPLKKTAPQTHTVKENTLGFSRGEHTDTNVLFRPRTELVLKSLGLSHRHISSPSASTEEPHLGVSELIGSMGHEVPALGSCSSGSRSAQLSLSSSTLDEQRPNTPLKPQMTSTVIYPKYIPCSGYSRPGLTKLGLGGNEGKGQGDTNLFSYGHSKGEAMSSYQAKHWACAIPKALPPSPDRYSAGWDPNREYQALLNYTYPLKPGEASDWGSSELYSVLQTDLQDSGVELEHFCSPISMTGLDFSMTGTGKTSEINSLAAGHWSPDLAVFTRSSDVLASSIPLSVTNSSGLRGLNSLYCSKDRGGLKTGHHQHHVLSTSTAFHTTSALHWSRSAFGEVEEEFWPLPEQLMELKLLSRQVREVTALLSQSVTPSWESPEPGTNSILSSITLSGKQEAEVKDLEGINLDTAEGKNNRESSAAQMACHRVSEMVRRICEAWVEPGRGGLNWSSLREVEALVEQLCDPTLPCSKRNRQEDEEKSNSLMQHIQVFCSHLEKLIQQLYTVSEKMELLAEATVDIDNLRSFVAEYQSFQKEVSSHQPLISCVLRTGQLLLSCINTTSPILRDTLLLIERQSAALQNHTEDLTSILSAMDNLTQPSQPSPV
ncbi:centrosomal protein of 68 kDa isoform X2 [Mastacembelus armatus]|uniref:centrosomal protein of 68 kDa isoform X2 n=1 Tax=Mastacembelus armatus TaxID=205130 RepID=UPI000E459384|nr:centrosomal protein of 68 kDa isoform X2 [Mastacembelus armatus]